MGAGFRVDTFRAQLVVCVRRCRTLLHEVQGHQHRWLDRVRADGGSGPMVRHQQSKPVRIQHS